MADTYDVLTYEEASTALGRGAADLNQADALERLITAASRRLDQAIGPIVARTVTSEAHDGGCTSIELNHGPISAIASITEYRGTSGSAVTAETAGAQPSAGYFAERYKPNPSLMSGVIVRRVSGNTDAWYPGFGNVLVTYTAGRVASTTAVDPVHKEAAVLILRNLWRPYDHSVGQVGEFDVPVQNFPAFALPNAVKDLLVEELQTSAGFG